jgi:outer membrane protein insertion porin family
MTFSQDFAGLGGDVRYIRTQAQAAHYWGLGGFTLSLSGEGGWIAPFATSTGPGVDGVRITDRFFLGEPQFRGFDIRGIGPRVTRTPYITDTTTGLQTLDTTKDDIADDALGGKAYYLGHIELELPLPAGAQELGLRPSIYMDVGALFGLKKPLPTATFPTHVDPTTKQLVVDPLVTPVLDSSGRQEYYFPLADGTTAETICPAGIPDASGACNGITPNNALTTSTAPFKEQFLGNSASPRLSVGIGVNWNSPFGPLRIDLAKALLVQPGDDKKLVTFNVGTQF